MKYRVDSIALRKLMIDNGYGTITDLERASGVNRNTLSGIINETIRPSTNVMDKLANALNMDQRTAGDVFFAPDLRDA